MLKRNTGRALALLIVAIAVRDLILVFLFIVGPLFVFSSQLIQAKQRGLVDYGDIVDDLFEEFDEKWAHRSDEQQKKMLGSGDPSSLADFGYSY